MTPPPSDERELLTVVIPCLNEEHVVADTVRSVLETDLDIETTILLVDDGSTDGTNRKMQELCAAHPECSMHTNPGRLGIGRTILETYKRLDPDTWITVVPGDNEVIFKSIKNHLAVRHDYDLVLGYFQNPIIRTFTRRMASSAFTLVARFLYGYPYRYLNGLALYRASIFQGIEVVSIGHAFNAELVAKALLRNPELRVGEVPFLARGRAAGQSKAFRPSSILRAVWEVYKGYVSVQKYRQRVIEKRDGNKAE